MSLVSMTRTAEQPTRRSSAKPERRARFARPVLGLLLPLALAVVWELAVRIGLSNGRLVPPPSVICATFGSLRQRRTCAPRHGDVAARVAAGFGLGVAGRHVAGAITGYSALLRRLLDPTLQALRAIPSIAWVPLFILWLGIFEASKITLIAVGVFFPVYLGVMGAIMSVDRKIVEVGRAFRLSGPAMVRRILLPAVLPAYVIVAALGARARLDVRGRGRIARRLRRARLSVDRRPAARQAGADRRRHRRLRRDRQDRRDLDDRRGTRRSCAGRTPSRRAEGD